AHASGPPAAAAPTEKPPDGLSTPSLPDLTRAPHGPVRADDVVRVREERGGRPGGGVRPVLPPASIPRRVYGLRRAGRRSRYPGASPVRGRGPGLSSRSDRE